MRTQCFSEKELLSYRTRIDVLQKAKNEVEDKLDVYITELQEQILHHRNKEIREVYKEITEDLAEKIGNEGNKTAVEKFSWEAIAKRTLDFYQKCVFAYLTHDAHPIGRDTV